MIEKISNRDTNYFTQLTESVVEIIDNRPNPRVSWYIDQGWAIVPMEQLPMFALHPQVFFTERTAEWLADAAASVNRLECFAIPVGTGDASDLVFRIPMQQESLLEFNDQYGGSEYALMPEDGSFCLLLTNIGYNLICGPREFVERAVGSSIPAARQEFQETTDVYKGTIPVQSQAPWYEEWDRISRRYYADNGIFGNSYDHADQVLSIVEAMILSDGWRFNAEWAKTRQWSVVPVFRDALFNAQEEEWLLKAAQAVQSTSLLVVDLDGTMVAPNLVYEVPVSADGIAYLTKTYSVTSCLVLTKPLNLAIVSYWENYKLIAGLPEFVEIAVGCSIPTARATFQNRYASAYTWNEYWHTYLQELSHLYTET
jgi:hypothetical protein